MIALNETNEYAAEVPFTLPLATDPLTGLSGYSFSLGEVQIQLPSAPGVWVDVDPSEPSRIVEKGYGRFAVRLTPPQCTTAGTVGIYAEVSGTQPYRGTETIGTQGGDISVGGIGWLVFYLADAVDPVYAPSLTGAFDGLAGALARVCWPDDTYQDVTASDVFEFGNGLYGIPVSTLNTPKAGKAYYCAIADGAQRYEDYSVISSGVAAAVPVVIPPPTPVIVPLTSSDEPFVNVVQLAVDRLCEYAKRKAS